MLKTLIIILLIIVVVVIISRNRTSASLYYYQLPPKYAFSVEDCIRNCGRTPDGRRINEKGCEFCKNHPELQAILSYPVFNQMDMSKEIQGQ